MTKLMQYLLNIWFRGYMDGYMTGREEELKHSIDMLRKMCKQSPSGYIVIRKNGTEGVEFGQVPKGGIKGWSQR